MATIYKLARFRHEIPEICPFCLINPSLGYTACRILGCRFCQDEVDKAIEKRFEVKLIRVQEGG